MKTKFFAIAALVLGLASCQRDFAPEGNVGGEVDFRLEVSAPELGATRADKDSQAGHDSAYGAIDYLSNDEWAEVDLRYILEVYDKADDYTNATPIKDRQVQIVDKYEPVKFEVRLAPGRDYHFVVFADFVPQGATYVTMVEDQEELGLRHKIGETLGDITFKKDANTGKYVDAINDEYADAYFATLDYTPSHNTHNTAEPIVLRRPYGKVRVVATDLAELNLNVEPRAVRVAYTAPHLVGFNAINGNIATASVTTEYDYIYAELHKNVKAGGLSQHLYTEGYDAMTAPSETGVERHTHMTLFTDYILATDVQSSIQFTMTVFDDMGMNNPIKTTPFHTDIPVQRNFLTTIIGNVLTTSTDINVSIDDNFATDDLGKSQERILLETLINGGVYDLKEDLTITARTWLDDNALALVTGDAVIRLNGHTLTYDIPTDMEGTGEYAIMTRIENGASLTFEGEGSVVADGYIASVNEGGVLNISEGTFVTESCTLFQSNGGEINITGGVFRAAEYNGDHRYTINFVDSKKQEGLIEISGGRFFKYNPSESHSEVPAMDFCANGFKGVEDGEYYKVVAQQNIELYADHAKVWSAEGLIQWAYIVNYGATDALKKAVKDFDAATFNKDAYGLEIMSNIKMPAKAIKVEGEAYVFTDEDITVENGIPSTSNWPVISDYETAEKDANGSQIFYGGDIKGNGHTIIGLRIKQDLVASGFLCWTKGAYVDNLTFSDAVVYNKGGNLGESYTGIVIGRCWHGSYVNNTHIKNSSVYGTTEVGALVGRVYHRTQKSTGEWLNEKMAYVVYCSTDENTTVEGDQNIGGIAGMNYGCVIGNCVSNATVIGRTQVGGIVGSHRSYFRYTDGYVIGCISTDKARVKATNGYAGGIAGHTMRDNSSHINTRGWIIGCTSLAQVNATYAASFIGNCAKNNGAYGNCIAASYAVTNLTDFAKGGAVPQIEAAYNVANVSELTQAHIDAMNAAIDAFNVSPDNIYVNGEVGAVMNKRWVLTANGPVLQ